MKKMTFLSIALMGLTGCSFITRNDTLGEDGAIWCNERYREPNSLKLDATQYSAATNGYMYALASALTLQKDGSGASKAHWFEAPSRLKVIDPLLHSSGFDRQTFMLHPKGEEKPVVIIAFSGSNDFWNDWIVTNFLGNMTQHTLAREYVSKMLKDERVKGKEVVVVGTSLGGALAIYAGLNPLNTRGVSQIWAFNPSPRTYQYQSDKAIVESNAAKTWVVASEGEILTGPRAWKFFRLFSGVTEIRTKQGQSVTFPLIESNAAYGHYRWGVARQALWIADWKLSRDGNDRRWTEPLSILAYSNFASCAKWRKENPVEEHLQPLEPRPAL